MPYCYQETETGTLLFSEEGIWYSTDYNCSRENMMGLYCTQENGSGDVQSLLVNSDESRQLVLVKFENILAFAFSRKLSVLSVLS